MTSFDDFRAGLALQAPRLSASVSGALAGMRGAKTALNVYLDETGIRTATGYSRIFDDTLDSPIRCVNYYHRRGALNVDQPITISGGHLFAAIGSAWNDKGGSLTDVKTRITTFNGYSVVTTGHDAPYQYDGSTFGAVSFIDNVETPILPTPFKPKGCWVHRNSLIYWGDPSTPYRLYKTAPGTHNDFSTLQADAIDVSLGDGEQVTGGISMTKGFSVVFKTESIEIMTGANATDSTVDPLTLTEYSKELGCSSPDTILSIGPEVFFLSTDGDFKRLSYVTVTGNINNYDPMYQALPILNTFDPTKAEQANAVFNPVERLVYLNFPAKDGSWKTLCYHSVTKGVWQRDGFNVTQQYYDKYTQTHLMARAEVVDAPIRVYVKNNSNSYDGVFYASAWECLYQATGAMNLRKFFSKFLAYFRTFYGSGVSVGIRIVSSDGSIQTRYLDFGDASKVDGWDIGKWDQAKWDYALASVARASRLGRGVAISVFFQASAGAAFWVDRIELSSDARGPDQR
jgi:hypothetical protein